MPGKKRLVERKSRRIDIETLREYELSEGEGTNNYIQVGHTQMTVRPTGMLIQCA
jgi:hypothetical protein